MAEEFIATVLKKAELDVKTNEDKDKLSFFDLEVTLSNRVFTIESKYDVYEAKSGNIAIEFFNPRSDKPTGIDATKADLWVHVLTNPTQAWVTKTGTLRRYIREIKPLRVIGCGGDSNASILLYERKKILPAIFHQLDGHTPADLKRLLTRLLK